MATNESDDRKEFEDAETAPAPPPDSTDAGDGSAGFFVEGRAPASHPGRVGPYRILKVLGQGGMGVVYLAAQTEPVRRQVALKLIKLGMDTREVVARFESERQALALMSHPAIARVYDAGATDDGRPYFVMEHVPGEPITTYCDRHRLTVRERLRLLVHVCEGVNHAHQKAIIHRDIKPSNILVMSQDGRATPRIIDFGVAKAMSRRLSDHTVETVAGQVIGTPAYMSPEQAAGEVVELDTRADIYSLGVLLYELLTGVLPFDSQQLRHAALAEIQRIICQEEPLKPSTRLSTLGRNLSEAAKRRQTEPRTLRRQFRGDLDWITMKTLAKERERRYATVAELADDVRRHLNHDPVLAGPPSIPYRLRKLLRKHRGPVASVAAVLLVVAVFAGITWYASAASFRRNTASARDAIAAGNVTAAEKIVAVLEEAHPDHPTVVRLSRELEALQRSARIASSGRLREAGEEMSDEFLRLRSQREDLQGTIRKAEALHNPWDPPWGRPTENKSRRELRAVEELVDGTYNDAVVSLLKALDEAPPGSQERLAVRKALERAYWRRYQEAEAKGEVVLRPEFFKRMIESLGVGTYAEALEGAGRLTVTSTPPGADVFCFRYKLDEEHLVPLPFNPAAGKEDPEKGLLAGPFLEIERVWKQDRSPFRPGDRFLAIAGRGVSRRGDVARALEGVPQDGEAKVKLLRAGKETTVSWTPFPSGAPAPAGQVVDFYGQFGFTFAGYPLEFAEGSRVGVTGDKGALAVRLPRGRYLFVFRKDGYAEARLPVVVPSKEESRKVRLFREGRGSEEREIPEGYVHIPGGAFFYGGDREAYMNELPGRIRHVDSFFVRRFEVTFGEYEKFLSDPKVFDRVDVTGMAPPAADWDAGAMKLLRPEEAQVRLVPVYNNALLFEQDDDAKRWRLRKPALGEFPLFRISLLAGVEYAHWLTEKDTHGFRYRLPTDVEWEKAARGVDRRYHVWGNRLVWTFCRSNHGSGLRRGILDPVGAFPLDESIYGVRDMAGSLSEPALTRATPSLRYCVLRGGSFDTTDPRDYRCATRNRRLPERSYRDMGLRLVAEVKR